MGNEGASVEQVWSNYSVGVAFGFVEHQTFKMPRRIKMLSLTSSLQPPPDTTHPLYMSSTVPFIASAV